MKKGTASRTRNGIQSSHRRPGKTRVTIRLDNEILDRFRNQIDESSGGNYQKLINDLLREHLTRQREPLETTIRRVIREELRRAG